MTYDFGPPPTTNSWRTSSLLIRCLFQVRQNYIRRRLQTTFRALQRLSQSELSLEQLLSGDLPAGCLGLSAGAARVPAQSPGSGATPASTGAAASAPAPAPAPPRAVTVRQVDRERGQPLTRFQRNMMVFNWLQTLDEDGEELKVA